MAEWVMLDGALMRDEVDVQGLLRAEGAVAVYADFGEEAAAAGPVLLPINHAPQGTPDTVASREAARAWRYGLAVLTTDASVEDVADHLRSIRTLHTSDGQRFFFRMADSRSMGMLWAVLREDQRAALLGPVDTWAFTDASGASVALARNREQALSVPLPIKLTDTALNRLTELSWPWHLLVAAEDAGAVVPPDVDDQQLLDQASEATRMVREPGDQAGFAVETSLAVALITTRGAASRGTTFAEAVSAARRSNTPDAIYRWLDELPTATTGVDSSIPKGT